MTTIQLYSVILLGAGLITRLLIGKNRFERRGVGGLQHYSNFWLGLIIGFFEGLFSIASYLMIIAGAVLLLVGWFNKH